jgi:carbonic anhydrase/acetyltransferase-like protein (isoleucine patch superfamily)
VQEYVVVHADHGICEIGSDVLIAHRALLHGCRVEDSAVIGMGAIVSDNAEVGEGAIIAEGAVVKRGGKIPPRKVAAGIPAEPIRDVNEQDIKYTDRLRKTYLKLVGAYQNLKNQLEISISSPVKSGGSMAKPGKTACRTERSLEP